METKAKQILITSIIIIAIIIVILVVALANQKGKTEENNSSQVPGPEQVKVEEVKALPITYQKYYNILSVANTYFNGINKSNYEDREGNSYADSEETRTYIYSLLSKKYIEEENITIENIYEHVLNINTNISYAATNMERAEGMGIDKYLVEGIVYAENGTRAKVEVAIFINIDYKHKTFSIEPVKEVGSTNIEIQNEEEEIEENDYNKFEEIVREDREFLVEKTKQIRTLILAKSSKFYNNMLDEEYKEKKFGSEEEFKEYVDRNYEELSTMGLNKYQRNVIGKDKDQYVCIDNHGKYMIIEEEGPTKTKIMLDTYTIEQPEFTEKYNKAIDSKKVGLNVEKIIAAINDKDYKYVYNLLDDTYKERNMQTLEKFEKYIERNFYTNNKARYEGIETIGKNFICELTLTDANGEESGEKNIKVIMQLLSGTEFVMSFSLD